MNLSSRIESILFVSSDPVKVEEIARITAADSQEVKKQAENLQEDYKQRESGIRLIIQGQKLQMITAPDNSDVIDIFTDQKVKSDLTDSQLEALSIIAYRSPITKPELEEIRGVNCTRIIRNLKKRGLVIEEEKEERLVPVYKLSFSALRHLGIESVEELPEYDKLSSHENIEQLLEQSNESREN